MSTAPVTPKVLAMLRWLAKQSNGIAGCPCRKGAATVARALQRRGLLTVWPRDRWTTYLALTEAGRTLLASLETTP